MTLFTSGPGSALDRTTALIETVALAPAPSVPTLQMTVRPSGAHEPGAWAPARRSPAGSGSVTTTPRASEGPALLTTIEKVTVPPTATGFGLADFRMLTSAVAAPTVKVWATALFPPLGSGVEERTVAAAVTCEPAASPPSP